MAKLVEDKPVDHVFREQDDIFLNRLKEKDKEISALNGKLELAKTSKLKRRGMFKYLFSDTPWGFVIAIAVGVASYMYYPDLKSPTDNFYVDYGAHSIYHEYDWGSDVKVWKAENAAQETIRFMSAQKNKVEGEWLNRKSWKFEQPKPQSESTPAAAQ